MTSKLLDLKQKIDTHIDSLQVSHPISPLIAQSIEVLIDMKATEDEMKSWYNIQKKFVRDIEKAIVQIEIGGQQFNMDMRRV